MLIKKKLSRLILTLIICFYSCLGAIAETRIDKPVKSEGIFSKYFNKIKSMENSYKTHLEIKYFEERIKKTPKNVELLKTYAKFLKDNHYYDEAIKIDKRLVELTKNDNFKKDIEQAKSLKLNEKNEKIFSDFIKQAKKYESQGNIVKANEYYLKAQKFLPKRYEVEFGLAKTYCWLNEPKLAIKTYQKLLKQSPDNIDLLEAYAGCLKDNKKYAQAKEIYTKLLVTTKNEKYNNNLQEIILLEKGITPKMINAELLHGAPQGKFFLSYLQQAQKYESQGNIAKANEYYLKAQKENPNRFEPKFGLAKTYGWLRQNKLALMYYKELLKEAPNNPDLLAAYNKFLKETKGGKNYQTKATNISQAKLQQQYQAQNIAIKKDKMFASYIKTAQDYENQGDAANANKYYLEANKIYPSRYEVKFGLAKTYGWLHKDTLASKYYQELLAKTPDNEDLLAAYANYLKDTKHYSEAMDIYNKLLAQAKGEKSEKNEQREKYKTNIAELFFLQNDYKTSLKLYFDIYKNNPSNLEIQKAIALNYFVSGDFKKSIEFYQKYLAQNPNPAPEAVLNYAKILFYTKQIDCAKEILERYVNAYPNDVEGLSILADIYMATKETSKASALINRGLLIEPKNVKLQIQVAKIDIQAKNYCRAKNILLNLLATNPGNIEILENLGDINFYNADFNMALRYFQCIPDYDKNPRLIYKIAQAYHYGKNYVVAQNLYEQLIKDPEFSNKSQIGLAEIQIEQDNPLKARAMLKKVLRNDPQNVQAKKNMAIAYYSTGDNLTSIKILEPLPREDTDINYNLAKAYNQIERSDVALDLLKNNPQKNAKALKGEILMQTRPAVEPFYHFYYMHPNNGNLNAGKYQKAGGNLYYYVKPNLRVVASGNATQYSNLNNIVSTIANYGSIGLEGKPTNHLSFRSAIGYDAFNDDGANNLILGHAVAKYSPNDVVTFTGGYIRSLDEIDSYMSAAGVVPAVGPFANQLVGRIVDNKYIMAAAFKLSKKFYAYGGMNVGNKYGSNSASNFYKEIPAGFGKVVYSAKEEKHINQALIGYDFYYTGYNEDMSGFGGANLNFSPIGSDGQTVVPFGGFPGTGGYFSPVFFIANKIPITIKGSFRESKLKYVASAFVGTQSIEGQIGLVGPTGEGPHHVTTTLYYGYSLGLRYNEKGRISWGVDYIFNNYMTVAQHLLKASLLIRF